MFERAMKLTVQTKSGLREVEAHESGVRGLFVIAATEAPGLFALSHSSGVGFSDTRFTGVQQAKMAAYLLRNIDWSRSIDDLGNDKDLDATMRAIFAWSYGIHLPPQESEADHDRN